MDFFEIILNIVMRFIVAPIAWVISLVWKFFTDVMRHLYWKIVVPIVAMAILAYLLSHFLK